MYRGEGEFVYGSGSERDVAAKVVAVELFGRKKLLYHAREQLVG